MIFSGSFLQLLELRLNAANLNEDLVNLRIELDDLVSLRVELVDLVSELNTIVVVVDLLVLLVGVALASELNTIVVVVELLVLTLYSERSLRKL